MKINQTTPGPLSSDEPAVKMSSGPLIIPLEVRAVDSGRLNHVKYGFTDSEELFGHGANGGVGNG